MRAAALGVRERLGSWWSGGGDVSDPLRLRPAAGADRLLCGLVLAMTALGLVMVFSAGAAFGAKRYGDWTYFLRREALFTLTGLCAFAFGLRTDYAFYRRWSYPLLALVIGLLVGVLFFGTSANRAVRWFRLGPLSFQPSEVAKFALVLYLAVLLSRNAERMRAFSMGFLPPLLMTGVVVGLIVIQPDLGTAIIMGLVMLVMLFVSGARTSYLVVAVLVTAPLVWKVLIIGKAWRMKRILAFLEPWQHCQNSGYQLCESLISVGSGGIWGQGLGASRQKLFFLPEAHTDFILAIIGEELGLIGVLALLTAFALLFWRGLVAALRARDAFGSYLAFGITALFALQALGNMGVVLGLLPTKGLALPFISYGGTSLVMSLFMAGVLGNISARAPEPRRTPSFPARPHRRGPGKNRHVPHGPRIMVELPGKKRQAPPPTPLSPEAPAPAPDPADAPEPS